MPRACPHCLYLAAIKGNSRANIVFMNLLGAKLSKKGDGEKKQGALYGMSRATRSEKVLDEVLIFLVPFSKGRCLG